VTLRLPNRALQDSPEPAATLVWADSDGSRSSTHGASSPCLSVKYTTSQLPILVHPMAVSANQPIHAESLSTSETV
jgi:hypothetical protein